MPKHFRNRPSSIPSSRPAEGGLAAIFVPAPGKEELVARWADPGSGIVGYSDPDSTEGSGEPIHLIVYFEGNRIGAANLHLFEEKVNCAYGRLVKTYPTVAMARLPADWFEVAGYIEGYGNVVVSDPDAVGRWTAFTSSEDNSDNTGQQESPQ